MMKDAYFVLIVISNIVGRMENIFAQHDNIPPYV